MPRHLLSLAAATLVVTASALPARALTAHGETFLYDAPRHARDLSVVDSQTYRDPTALGGIGTPAFSRFTPVFSPDLRDPGRSVPDANG